MEVFWNNGNIFLNNILIGKFSRKIYLRTWIQDKCRWKNRACRPHKKTADRLYFREKFSRDLRYINEWFFQSWNGSNASITSILQWYMCSGSLLNIIFDSQCKNGNSNSYRTTYFCSTSHTHAKLSEENLFKNKENEDKRGRRYKWIFGCH